MKKILLAFAASAACAAFPPRRSVPHALGQDHRALRPRRLHRRRRAHPAEGARARAGQAIVIENKPGAGSTIGTAEVANAKPDGYTLVMVSTAHVISPHLYKQMPYDALRDFSPVMKLAEGPYVLVVHPSLGL
jgi:hypothetical protein